MSTFLFVFRMSGLIVVIGGLITWAGKRWETDTVEFGKNISSIGIYLGFIATCIADILGVFNVR